MISTLKTKVRGGWWLNCGHKIILSECVHDAANAGLKVECAKCDRKLSRHASNKLRPTPKTA